MIAIEGSTMRRAALVPVLAAALAAVVIACRSGAQVPKTVELPVIQATVSSAVCLNDRYPEDAPEFGDNSTVPYKPEPSGLRVFDHVTGSGGTPSFGDVVTVHYTGWLENGCIFDSSYIYGEPGDFRLERLIAGWGEAVRSMQAGGRRRVEIPPALAYGSLGFPGVIPPNATLIFEIELLSFATPTPTPEAAGTATPATGAEPSATPTP